MNKEGKDMVSFTISKSHNKFLGEQAEKEGRSKSGYLDRLIAKAIEMEQEKE